MRRIVLAFAALLALAPGPLLAGNAIGAYSPATLGTTPTQVAAQNSSRTYLDLVNQSATATVSCLLGPPAAGTATTNGAGSITLAAGAHREWNIFVPADAVWCVASAGSTPFTLGQK